MNWSVLQSRAKSRLTASGVVPEGRAFLGLAVPLATAQVAQFAVGFVDTLMMGHLNTASLAAGGLASTTFQMLLTIVSGFVMSVGVLAAEAYGSEKKKTANGPCATGALADAAAGCSADATAAANVAHTRIFGSV